MTITRATAPPTAEPSIVVLARVEAGRFARHPLAVFSVAVLVLALAVAVANRSVVDVAAMDGMPFMALLLGVFGFVVAHRLTSSFRSTADLTDTSPTSRHRRTAALCLACLVPAAAGIVLIGAMVVFGAIWPPEPVPPGDRVAWFNDEPFVPMLAALVASVPLAALGGSLLGVTVARWAPFRGSALLGAVLLVVGVAFVQEAPRPWVGFSPWLVLGDAHVDDGTMRSSWLRDDLSPVWYCLYLAGLCALAVVAALWKDATDRRRLLLVGAGAGVVAAVAGIMTVG
jgi:hypothetical protein